MINLVRPSNNGSYRCLDVYKQYHEIFADSVLPARLVLETRSIVLQAGSDRTSCSSDEAPPTYTESRTFTLRFRLVS